MKKRYETPELEVLLFDLREIAMVDCDASGTSTGTVYPDFDVWNNDLLPSSTFKPL